MHNSDHSFPCLKKKQRKKNFQKLSEAKSSAYNFCFNYKQTNYMHGPSLFLSILSVNHQVVYLIHHISQPFSTSNNPIGYVNNATHTQNNNNEWTNERMIRPHNLQKSLNKLPSCTCKQITICCFPTKKHICILIGLLITGCGISNPKYTSGKFILIYSLLNQ